MNFSHHLYLRPPAHFLQPALTTLMVVITTLIFILDLVTPLGIATGIAYVFVILLGYFSTGHRKICYITTVCIGLVILGYFFSPTGIDRHWAVLSNRFISTSCIAMAAVFTINFKKLTHKHQNNETLLKSILTSANESVLVVNEAGDIVYHNESANKMFGFEEAELKGIKLETLVPDKLKERHVQLRENYAKSPQARAMGSGMNLKAKRKDGSEFPVEISLGFFDTKKGYYFTCFIIDVTVRKETEAEVNRKNEALAKSEHFLNSIIQNLPLHISVKETESMNIVLENKRAQEILGYYSHEFEGKTVNDFIGKNITNTQAEQNLAATNEVLKTAKTVIIPEFPVLSKTGEEKVFRLTKAPIIDAGGKVIYLINISEDITESHKAQRELEKKHQLLLESQEIGNVGSFERDLACKTLSISNEMARILGVTEQEKYPHNFLMQYVHPDDRERVQQDINNAITENIIYDGKYRIIRPDGKIRYVWLKAKTILDEEDNPVHLRGLLSDITDLKKAEEETKKANTELSATNKMLNLVNSDLEQFVYATSHEMQEPVRMISSHTQMLRKKMGPLLCEEKKEQMQFIINEAGRMLEIISGVREYINLDKIKEEPEIVSTENIVKYVEKLLSEEIKKHNAVIKTDQLPSLPGRKEQLISLFKELIENAIKFKSGNNPEITITANELEHGWEFRVKDNGISIDQKYDDKIFRIFKKLHTYYEYQGPGVGLAIAKKVVKLHGGRIWYHANEGNGTTFCFTLRK